MLLRSILLSALLRLSHGFTAARYDTNRGMARKPLLPFQPAFCRTRSMLRSASQASTSKEVPSVDKRTGKVVILLPSDGSDTTSSKFGIKSPVEPPPYKKAAVHLVDKIYWFSDGLVDVEVTIMPNEGEANDELKERLVEVDALLALGLSKDADLALVEGIFEERRARDLSVRTRQCHFALDCTRELPSVVGPYGSQGLSLQSELIPWSEQASGRRLNEQMVGLFDRWTTDDFALALMLFFNQFSGSKVDWVKYSTDATWEKGPVQNAEEFYKMVTKCGDCITKCLADDNCKACINALNSVDARDQVASYRTVVSYESELLKEFSYCILQKNNIFGCRAKIPTLPQVEPIKSWRGQEMTTDLARKLLVGHLKDEPIALEMGKKLRTSWIVAAGANAAYDQFPNQNQIFYEAVGNDRMWYDPVFRVETIDGRKVWCKRHYTVRNGKAPGTFRLSVLDNGVTSNEFWTIGGVADDLSWIVFHYAGAATVVGQRYIGGLLCTPDGALPPPDRQEEWMEAMHKVRIQPWELCVVDNTPVASQQFDLEEPPLDFYRKEVLDERAKVLVGTNVE